jgi:glycosyltransferase involved in cell wall biosynthesis
MNICLVAQEYPPETAIGGIGTQTWNKARALSKLGHSVHVLSCGSQNDGQLRTMSHDNVMVYRMTPPDRETNGCYNPPTYWLGYTWLVLRQLRQLVKSIRFDIIDFPEYGAEGFAFQLDRTVDNWIPVAVQLHGPLAMFGERIGWPPTDSDFFRVGTFMEDYSIKSADALMACSANIADFTAQYHGVPRDQIDVVHCGVDTDMFHPATASQQREHHPIALFAGNLALSKGLGVVLDAVLRLRTKFPGISLQIAGRGDADLVGELKAKARAAGAESNIEIRGFLDRQQIADAYRDADIFCSPALHEPGVANVYIEAMASGCPVVACNGGGAPEAVIDGVTGALIAGQDSDAAAAAMDRILSDSNYKRKLSANARKRVEEYFAMDHYIQRVLATYHRAIESSQRKLKSLSAGMHA